RAGRPREHAGAPLRALRDDDAAGAGDGARPLHDVHARRGDARRALAREPRGGRRARDRLAARGRRGALPDPHQAGGGGRVTTTAETKAEPGRVLVVDDDASFRFAMRKALRRHGYEVAEADGGEAALPILNRDDPPDAALLDLRMGDIDGLDVLRRSSGTPTRIVVLTGHGSVEAAVEAMKLGAFSFLEKPVDADLLAPLLDQAIAEARGQRNGEADLAPTIIGVSEAMEEVRRFIAQVGPTAATVAIYGET